MMAQVMGVPVDNRGPYHSRVSIDEKRDTDEVPEDDPSVIEQLQALTGLFTV